MTNSPSSPYFLQQIFKLITAACENDATSPVGKNPPPQELKRQLRLELTQEGTSEEELLQLLQQILAQTPRTGSKRFYNQLFSGRNDIALGGELLAATMNNSIYTYKVGGAHILIEQEVLRKMLMRVGFSAGQGVFCPGGSLSNLVGLLMARQKIAPWLTEAGGGGDWVVYSSAEGHYSVQKNTGFVGLGRQNFRPVKSDTQGRISITHLEKEIKKDRSQGKKPLLINGTAGTTVHGAFDDIGSLRKIADKEGCWLHIDGAYGGSLLMSHKYRRRLAGIEEADSVTWDAHKLMGVPLLASALLTRHTDILQETLLDRASYLFQQDEDEYNPGLMSLQCARRNDALKLWCLWKHLGDEGYAAYIERLVELTEYAAEQVLKHPSLELAMEPQCTTVCLQVLGQDSRALCENLDREGLMKVGHGAYKGEHYIRLSIAHPQLTQQDIDETIELLAGLKA